MAFHRLILLLSIVLAFSAAAGAIGAALAAPSAWFTIVFEALVLLAAGFGVQIGLSRGPRHGLALAVLCIAGVIAVASVLGYAGLGQTRQIWGSSARPFLFGRLALAGIFGLAAAGVAIQPAMHRALPRLLLGLALIAPVAAFAALMSLGTLRPWLSTLGSGPKAIAAVVGFIACTALLAAGTQLIFSAFALAARAAEPSEPTSPAPTPRG